MLHGIVPKLLTYFCILADVETKSKNGKAHRISNNAELVYSTAPPGGFSSLHVRSQVSDDQFPLFLEEVRLSCSMKIGYHKLPANERILSPPIHSLRAHRAVVKSDTFSMDLRHYSACNSITESVGPVTGGVKEFRSKHLGTDSPQIWGHTPSDDRSLVNASTRVHTK
jgi:hypothetical protein